MWRHKFEDEAETGHIWDIGRLNRNVVSVSGKLVRVAKVSCWVLIIPQTFLKIETETGHIGRLNRNVVSVSGK